MKKFFIINILFICALSISAQIRMQNTGRVGIGVSSGTLLSQLSIGDLGDASAAATINGGYNTHTYGLKITNSGASGARYGLLANTTICSGSGPAVGVQGQAQYTNNCPIFGVGVRGLAGGISIVVRAYGVSGLLTGKAGAGVYGGFGDTEAVFQGKYAGYFEGNVGVTGTLNGVTISPSDSRLKKNVIDLDYQLTLDKLMLLRPVEYNMQQVTFEVDSTDSRGDVVTYSVNRYDETTDVFQNKHYGLIAQEVQRIYPDLVYEGSDGYLGIDYVSLIPMLLKVVQQQQIEIDQLKRNESAPVSPNNAPAKPQEVINEGIAALFQNTPNPFNENTEIAFYLPQNVTNAMLCVYDMNGRQLSQNVITQRGSASFVVNGSQYGAGMYLYSLIADNQLVDTKRMILTK